MTLRALAKAIGAQCRTEIALTLRRGESVLITLVIPIALLTFFASARVLPSGGDRVGYLLPGTLALAIISTSMVSLGIATAYERYYGVLKRLGATPFPRAGLVAAKMLAVAGIEVIQVVLLVLIAAIFFGWRSHGSPFWAAVFLILGTLAFSGIGLALAGRLRAEATLAGANGLFVFFLLIGGLFVPLDHLPAWLVPPARLLPADALSDALRTLLQNGHYASHSILILTLWAFLAPLVAARVFRWE